MYATILTNEFAEPRAKRVRNLMRQMGVELRDEVHTDSVSQEVLDDMADEFDTLPIVTLRTDDGRVWDEFDASNLHRLNASSVAACQAADSTPTHVVVDDDA